MMASGTTDTVEIPEQSGALDRIAVFIDCDGVSAKDADRALSLVSKHGHVTLVRTYGTHTGRAEDAWAKFISRQGSIAYHVPTLSLRKNATDIALTVDAVEVLLTHSIEVFVLVVSDADFLPLAHRIRAGGKRLFSFGQQSVPNSLRDACDRFWELRSLRPSRPPGVRNPDHWKLSPGDAEGLIVGVLSSIDREGGLVSFDMLAQALRKADTDFDPRTYGRRTLGAVLAELPSVEVLEENGKRLVRRASGTGCV